MAETRAALTAEVAVSGHDVLLATKLHLPRPRPGFVPRPRLAGPLDAGLAPGLPPVRPAAGAAGGAGEPVRPAAAAGAAAGPRSARRAARRRASVHYRRGRGPAAAGGGRGGRFPVRRGRRGADGAH